MKQLGDIVAKTFPVGSVVFHEGDKSDGNMYFVAHGTVLVSTAKSGRPQFMRRLEKGQFFGEMALINSVPRTANVHVESETAKLIVIDSATFVNLGRKHPSFLYKLLATVYARIVEAEARLDAIKDNVDRTIDFNVLDYVKNVFIRSFRRGDFIFAAGDISDGMLYSVMAGEVALMRSLPDGLMLETAVIKEGGVFGEDGILSGDNRKISAQVKSEYAKIGGLNKETFLRVGAMKPEFFFRLLRLCIERLIALEDTVRGSQR
ncbi:MAG: cyclic nucleotide-binding domain-containing protein [Spirochaetia bacterium]|nr:cyclic nucleotide-binding domain-containing protein [Spirochaetia bacterium]